MNKKLGVLLSVSSLPGRHGIGDFGDDCYRFIDWLHKNKYTYWQVLPINPLGPGYSPYMSTCSNAIEYRYISLDYLTKQKLIKRVPDYLKETVSCDFFKVGEYKKKYLYQAYKKFMKLHPETIHKFKFRQPWVAYYATFEVFKWHNEGKQWNEWREEDRDYYLTHNRPPKKYLDEINFVIFMQYVALKQWKHVLAYAKRKGIKIICDMPFYVGFDGVECWLHRDQFSIGPDNKLYRVGYLMNLCDLLRIDHFRAFDTYYVIPGDAEDARIGEWKIGPQDEFFKELYKKYPKTNLIAEDLGDLRPEVLELRDRLNLPGMFISEFTIFDLKNLSTEKQIVYPGTHDNETLWGWFNNLNDEQKEFIKKRLGVTDDKKLYDEIVKYIFTIPSLMTIFPLQDLLKLDNSCRMNSPGTVGSPNWEWKLSDHTWEKKIKYPNPKWFK